MNSENLPTTINNNFPTQGELQTIGLIARTAYASGLYSGIGGEAKILMILLAAKELGIGPCVALNGGIWNINGRIEISARLMNSMIRRPGHTMQITSTKESCTIKAKRADSGEEHTETFTWAMAEKAGLAKKDVWQKYPEDMLYNRCISRLARRLFPDVIGSAYIEGEIREAKEEEKRFPEIQYEEIPKIEEEKSISFDEKTEIQIAEAQKQKSENIETLSKEELDILLDTLKNCDREYNENLLKNMKQYWNTLDYEQIPRKNYKSLIQNAQMNIEMNRKKDVNNAAS